MGQLPLSSIVTVNISASPSFTSQAGFGTLMCVTAEAGVLDATERARTYAGIDGVTEDWGAEAEVTKMATAYFSQSPKPTSLMVGFMDTTETPTEAMTAIEEFNSSWYGFAFTKEVRDLAVINTEDAVEELATWAEARIKVFFTTTNSVDALVSTSVTDIAYVLKQKDLSRTFVMYSSSVDEYPEVSVAGRAFSVDFTSGNPSITLKFKKLPTITVEGLSFNKKSILDEKGCNALISIAGNTILAEGIVSGGRFFDEIHGIDFLRNSMEENVFLTLYGAGKVGYTDVGVAKLAQVVGDVLAQGVQAGLIAPGTDSNGNFLGEGYRVFTVSADDMLPTKVGARLYDGISFVALGAGAIHSVVINGVFER